MVLTGIFIASILAGIFNTMAAGGSFLMLPLLIFAGLPPTVANGTNRVALLAQNAASQYGFIKEGFNDLKINVKLAIPAVLGSVIGSFMSVKIPDVAFKKILSILMILFVIIMIFSNNKKKIKEKSFTPGYFLTFVIFIFVGIYGGFIQAGVGLFLIGSIKLCTKFDLVKVNSVKTFIIASYTIVAIVIFAYNGKIDWTIGLIVAVGQGIGGYIGSKVAVKGGEKIVKKCIIIAIVLMAIRLFMN